MVAIGPQRVEWKVVVKVEDADVKEWVILGGDETWKASGTEKEKPGGIVVVDGLWTSKEEGDDGDGSGRMASVESGAKVMVLVNWESWVLEMYSVREGLIRS